MDWEYAGMEKNAPFPQSDTLFRKLVRSGIVIGVFIVFGVTIGMGFFSKPMVSPMPAGGEEVVGPSQEPNYAIVGAMVSEVRADGQEWQSLILTGQFNQDLDGALEMSLYQEPGDVLRARFEADARREGWRELGGASGPDNRLELCHDDGRVRIISIDEYAADLRSVTVFTGTLSRRR